MKRIGFNFSKMLGKPGIKFSLAFLFVFFFHSLSADMGSILTSNAKVREHSQKAIILHNFNDEILILGTDLQANYKTSIVRFIPFPSEPIVKLAPSKAFKSAAELVKSHELQTLFYTKGGAPLTKSVEIHFSRKLGVHDITVIKINNTSQFREWVNQFFKSKKIPQRKSFPNIEKIVKEYVSRGIKWFVFDYVNVTMETHMIQPVEYRFKSKKLYYPLLTSNTFGGQGAIDLIMVTPNTPCNLYPDCFRMGLYGMQATTSSQLRYDELANILPEAKQFFGGKKIFIQMAQYWGSYEFSNDIFYDLSKGKPLAQWVEQESPGIVYSGFNHYDNSAPVYQMKLFQPTNKSFSVKIPASWQKKESANTQTGADYRLILTDQNRTSLEIEHFPEAKLTAEQYMHKLTNPERKPPYEDFGEVKPTSVAGHKALKVEIKTKNIFTSEKKQVRLDVVRRYVVIPEKKGFFVLRMETPLSIAQKHQALFFNVTSSFHPSDN